MNIFEQSVFGETGGAILPPTNQVLIKAEDVLDLTDKPVEFTNIPGENTDGPKAIGGDFISGITLDGLENPKVNTEGNVTTQNIGNEAIYSALAKEIVEGLGLGIEDDKIDAKDTASLISFLKEKVIEKKAEEALSERIKGIGPKGKKFLDLKEYFDDETHLVNALEDNEIYNSITDDAIENDDELAKEIFVKALQVKGLSADKIKEEVDDAIALNKIESKAKSSLNDLKTYTNTFIEKVQAAKKELANKDSEMFNKVLTAFDMSEELNGLKMTKELKSAVKESLTKVVHKDNTGKTYNEVGYKQLQHGKEFDKALSIMSTLGLLSFDKEGKYAPDFSKLSGMAAKKLSNKLDSAIEEQQKTGNSAVGGSSSTGSLADILAMI